MSTVIVPIVKNKKCNITDMDNYRPIAITTVFSKVIELLLLHRYSDLLCTTDNQFGFRTEHSTDMCVFALKQVIDFYISNNSPMFICYMDASKAFDRINHWSLFRRLLNRSIPKLIVRLIIFWYTMQTFIIQCSGARVFLLLLHVLMGFARVGYFRHSFLMSMLTILA